MEQAVSLAKTDPIGYLNVFVEILTLFKATIFDYESMELKNEFMKKIK